MSLTEFSRRFVIEPWPRDGITIEIAADARERHALAERFGLLEVGALRGRGRLEPIEGGAGIRFRGHLEAEVVQSCVVSLEPVPATVREPVERCYRRADADGGMADETMSGDEDEVEILTGSAIDLGEVLAEELALALEPYPRRAGAVEAVARELGPGVTFGPAAPSEGAFAALRRLQQDKHAR